MAGGLFSVALSVGLPRPGVTRHRFFLESGLSSPVPEGTKAVIQPSAQDAAYAQGRRIVNAVVVPALRHPPPKARNPRRKAVLSAMVRGAGG